MGWPISRVLKEFYWLGFSIGSDVPLSVTVLVNRTGSSSACMV